MDFIVVAAWIISLTVDVLIVVGCIWAYRRFHFESFPWIAAYFVLKEILPYFTAHFMNQAMIQHPASGNPTSGLQLTINEVAPILAYASKITSAFANGLIAWFILSELDEAYSIITPKPAVPAIVSIPMRHSYAVGIVLLLCAIAIPWCWFAFSVM